MGCLRKDFQQSHEVLRQHLILLNKPFGIASSRTSESPILASSSRREPNYRAKNQQDKEKKSRSLPFLFLKKPQLQNFLIKIVNGLFFWRHEIFTPINLLHFADTKNLFNSTFYQKNRFFVSMNL